MAVLTWKQNMSGKNNSSSDSDNSASDSDNSVKSGLVVIEQAMDSQAQHIKLYQVSFQEALHHLPSTLVMLAILRINAPGH